MGACVISSWGGVDAYIDHVKPRSIVDVVILDGLGVETVVHFADTVMAHEDEREHEYHHQYCSVYKRIRNNS